jgi:hypothetical protein
MNRVSKRGLLQRPDRNWEQFKGAPRSHNQKNLSTRAIGWFLNASESERRAKIEKGLA